jgi:transposase, IS5 family
MANLIREDDRAVYGDKGYASDEKKRVEEAAGVFWALKEKAKPGRALTKRQRARNRRFGKVRAKVEHVFRVLKCQFGYRKVRYRGIVSSSRIRLAITFASCTLPVVTPAVCTSPLFAST